MSQNLQRISSGMRPTGALHIGHYHGVLKNWLTLQHEYECFFFAADWHALSTHYDDVSNLEIRTHEMVIDWLAVGIDPQLSCIFAQSMVPEHGELFVLLSMIAPLGWLERMPTYKDTQLKLKDKDLATYGFLGYPLLQAADILIYRASYVPVGEDQVVHLEYTREMARRFNHSFGRGIDFETRAQDAIQQMGKKQAKLYRNYYKAYHEMGDKEALLKGHALVTDSQNLTLDGKEHLHGYLEGTGKILLPEPESLLTKAAKVPGTDGQKMSKSYGNAIGLREEAASVEKKIRTMQTDPQRVRREDPGNPEVCPVWGLHQLYASDDLKQWVVEGCTTAKIGCLDCKKPLIDAILKEQQPIKERAEVFERDKALVKSILHDGAVRARDEARKTLKIVKEAMGLNYS